jgi:hypothetical protein
MLRVDTERRFLSRFKNWGSAPSNVSKIALTTRSEILWTLLSMILTNRGSAGEWGDSPIFLEEIPYLKQGHIPFFEMSHRKLRSGFRSKENLAGRCGWFADDQEIF